MRVGLLLVLLALAPVAAGQQGRIQVEPYWASLGAASPTFYFCDTDEGNVGGACFRLSGDETFASVAVQDEAGWSVVGVARFYDHENRLLARHVFCTELPPTLVPEGSRKLVVLVGPLGPDASKLEECAKVDLSLRGRIALRTFV